MTAVANPGPAVAGLRSRTPTALDLRIAAGLRTHDKSVLAELWDPIAPRVIRRLECRVAPALRDLLEDAASIEIKALWDDPAKFKPWIAGIDAYLRVAIKHRVLKLTRNDRLPIERGRDLRAIEQPVSRPASEAAFRLLRLVAAFPERWRLVYAADRAHPSGTAPAEAIGRGLGVSAGAVRAIRKRLRRRIAESGSFLVGDV